MTAAAPRQPPDEDELAVRDGDDEGDDAPSVPDEEPDGEPDPAFD